MNRPPGRAALVPSWPQPAARASTDGSAGEAGRADGTDWIFEDPRSRALLTEVEQVAPSEASILITGETGTGKELIARQIHNRSLRRNGPFVVVSCGAFSESLVDAELFGHESGAFAGAFGTQIGWFEAADGGTIFLDEVNDLPLSIQNKLLRVLQQREIIRLGAREPIPVDLRIIAATTVDLEALVAARQFRKDLYYRLNVVSLEVLTLKERPGDIVPLARNFIEHYSRRLGYPRSTLLPEAERLLVASPWPGNVRELENVVHRTLLQAVDTTIGADDLRLTPRPGPDAVTAVVSSRARVDATATSTAWPRDGQAADLGATPVQREPERSAGQWSGADRVARLETVGRSAADGYEHRGADLRRAIRDLCEAAVPDLYQLVEDTLFLETFRYCHYSQSETARVLGLSRNIVRARLIRLGEVAGSRRSPGTTGEATEAVG